MASNRKSHSEYEPRSERTQLSPGTVTDEARSLCGFLQSVLALSLVTCSDNSKTFRKMKMQSREHGLLQGNPILQCMYITENELDFLMPIYNKNLYLLRYSWNHKVTSLGQLRF